MPSKTAKQAKLMRAVAHGWKPTRIKGPPVSVAKEFVAADKKYSGGFAESRYAGGGPVRASIGGLLRHLMETNPEVRTAIEMAMRGQQYDPGGTERTLEGTAPTTPPPVAPRVAAAPPPGPVGYPAPTGRESPQREQLRAHQERVRAMLQGPSRVKTPPAPSGPIKMQFGGLAAMMAAKTRGAPRRPMGGFGGRGPVPGQSLAHLRGRGIRYDPATDPNAGAPVRIGAPPGTPGFPPQGGRTPLPRGGGMRDTWNPDAIAQRRRIFQESQARRGRGPRMGGPRRGPVFGGLAQMMMQRQGRGMPGGMGGRPGAPGGRGAPPVGPRGGPQTPPNLQGMFQRMRMQNRPRMGPMGGGGNRVGQQDQQGALARALQRGTGRPPMSRRYSFPGRR